MKLEELTKEELIRLIEDSQFSRPSEHDINVVHWKMMSEASSRIMDQACKEADKWIGDANAYKQWSDAQKLFDKGSALADKAQDFFNKHVVTGRGVVI